MKIQVEFLSLPLVTKIIGSKKITLDCPGPSVTIASALETLCNRYGEKVRSFLLDPAGQLDPTLKIMLDKKEWIKNGQMDISLTDGAHLSIMMLVGGG